jgi:hypothetical protein
MRIQEATESSVADLWDGVAPAVRSAATLEEAAQAVVASLHQKYDESVLLARVFVTVPFGQLPASNQRWVRGLAESAGAEGELNDTTPVLSLIGTHGDEADLCDRRKSQGHVGIPLISASFVEAIPMISRLLKELGVPVEWVDSHDSEMIVNAIGDRAGLFFVDSAADAVDHEGRKIIVAQDFVAQRGIRSVFGAGGAYATGQILVIVCFCRDGFTRQVAQQFLPLVSHFTEQTTPVGSSAIFAP